MTENEILIKIKADSDQAVKEIKSLNTQVKKLSKTSKVSSSGVNKLNKSLGSTASSLKAVATSMALFQGFSHIVGTISEFETVMKKVGAVSGATGDEFKKLETAALDMGNTTRYSATQSAEALNFLAMAGFSVEDSITALPDVLNLATVGNMDLATASDIASDSLTAFGLEADDMTKVADVMAETITSSNTNIEMLGASFKKVAPVATSLGVSIEETSAALGVMADSGLKAEIAGTNLKISLLRLTSPAKKGKEALASLGVQIYNDAGKFRGLGTTLGELKEKLSVLSEQKRIDLMKDIFGTEALAGATTMINNITTIKDRTVELGEANGTASEISKEMNDTLAAAWDQVKSAIEGVILSSKDTLLPLLKDLTTDTSAWIRSFDKESIRSFTEGVTSLATALGNIVTAVKDIYNYKLPDWMTMEDGAGLGETVYHGWQNIGEGIRLAADEVVGFANKVDEAFTDPIEMIIGIDTEEADKKLDETEDGVDDLGKKVIIDGDTTKSDEDVAKVADDIASLALIEPPIDVDASGANSTIEAVQSKASEPTDSTHTVDPNTTAASTAINALKVNTSSTHTVYVRTVQTNATGGEAGLPKFANGGGFPKRNGQILGHDTTGKDDVPSMLTRGEFVHKVAAVDYYGRDMMRAINSLQFPKPQKYAEGGSVSSGKTVNLNLTMPSGESFSMMSDSQVASALERHIRKMS